MTKLSSTSRETLALVWVHWRTLVVVGILLALVMPVRPALAAGDIWTVLPFTTRGVEPDLAETFRELLQSELSARRGVSFVQSPRRCADAPCAQMAAREVGAHVVIFGAMTALGSKLIVIATAVDAERGDVLNSDKMAVDQVEDLDAVAARIAAAIVEGKSVDETAELGAITREEVAPDRRRHGDAGIGLRLGGLVPLLGGYAGAGVGVLLDTSYWYEAPHFAIEPRVGVRFSAGSMSRGAFVQVPIDVGAYYIAGLRDVAFFMGGGAGVRYVWEKRPETVTVGTVVRATHTADMQDDGWGVGLFGRVGLILFRTYAVRVTMSVDYDVTFVDLSGRGYLQAVTFGAGVLF